MQGRYLFAAIVPFAVVVGAGAGRLLGRRAPALVLAAAALMHLEAGRVGLQNWWAEPDASVQRSIAAALRWSPWPTVIIGAVIVAAAVFAAIAVVASVRLWRAQDGVALRSQRAARPSPAS